MEITKYLDNLMLETLVQELLEKVQRIEYIMSNVTAAKTYLEKCNPDKLRRSIREETASGEDLCYYWLSTVLTAQGK